MVVLMLPMNFFIKTLFLIKVLLHLSYGQAWKELHYSGHCLRKGEFALQYPSTSGVKQRNNDDGIWREFNKIILNQRIPVSYRPLKEGKSCLLQRKYTHKFPSAFLKISLLNKTTWYHHALFCCIPDLLLQTNMAIKKINNKY